MRVLRCADSGVLVEVADLGEVMALHAALAEDPPEGVGDIVPAARTVLLRIAPGGDPDAVAAAVGRLRPRPGGRAAAGELEVPVQYDGRDLAGIAELTGLTEREVVRAHTGAEWAVAFCGFAPGFGYLVGDDPRLHVPRRGEARTRVPAGAVALAGEFSGIYPRASPGGWQLLGSTELVTWDLDRDPPALLRPGVRVRFTEEPPAPRRGPGGGRRAHREGGTRTDAGS
ncbi:5-oxoprolinase subunit B family protein [Streptomonospora salina]|uniref:Allophanate hydrolase subunit 1 n=1 Tax=Streptomonospora salina TaxID=104205 RepID=A0A841EN41_9ACTN|nr:allophanate hydrolase subunit 1 [Streptomonospora salina]MBB6000841.1 allophanate hydrolase subunit 1 [Streptomonospora salina]